MVSDSTLDKLEEMKNIGDKIQSGQMTDEEGYQLLEKIIYSIGE